MKKVLFFVASLLLYGVGTAMAGQLGPAEPLAKKGEFSLGTGLFYYPAELDNDTDLDQTQLYAQIGYGLLPNTEIYIQLGGADIDFDGQGNAEFEDGYRPFGTVGVRSLLLDRKPIAMGVFLQGSYFSEYKDSGVKVDSFFEVNGGIALQTVIEGATLYGGPLFYVREGDLSAGGQSESFEERGNVGGYVGIRWPLKNRMAIELESQIKTGVSIGAAIHYVF